MTENIFYTCEMCGGKLIERLPNGVWKFRFGKQPGMKTPAVDIEIYGSLRIKCWRRYCQHVNTLTYFPGQDFPNGNQSDAPMAEKVVEEDGV